MSDVLASASSEVATASREPVQVDVPCGVCGGVLVCEVDTPGPNLVAFCNECRGDLLATPDLPAGYELERELGRGGMGAVYLVRHRALGVERAVKVVLPQGAGALSEAARTRFLDEARLHARLSHPRIVQIHDLCEVRSGVFAIVMEYVPGPDAGALLKSQGGRGLPPAQAVDIAAQALEALAYVHTQGVLHCDVKDPNLLLRANAAPDVKLSDFGLARVYAESGARGGRRAECASGTIPYMSPEQAYGLPLSPATDVYALGATLYRLLTGTYPHDFPSGCDRLAVVRDEAPVPVRVRAPHVGPALAEVVDGALARDVEHRIRGAEQMRLALRGL